MLNAARAENPEISAISEWFSQLECFGALPEGFPVSRVELEKCG